MPSNHLPEAPEVEQNATSCPRTDLLQIIAGTSDLMEDIWTGDHGSEKYHALLRASVQQAANITAHFVEHGLEREKEASAPSLTSIEEPLATIAPRPAARRPRILVVDDEPVALLLFHELLSLAGYQVVTAQSGFECLDLVARSKDFDVAVLDLTMPFMDGEETFRRLQVLAPEVPILLTTGHIEPARLATLRAAGLFGFIAKPLPPDEFLEQVAIAVAARKSALAEANSGCGIAAA